MGHYNGQAVASPITSGYAKGEAVNDGRKGRPQNLIMALGASDGGADDNDARGNRLVAHTLRSEGADASEDGTGRGTPIVVDPQIFQTRIARNGRGQPSEVANALTSCEGGTHADSKPHVFGGGQTVRRLTPTECLRLQGFSDDWLDLDPPLSDSAKYRMIGNAVVVSVAEWIGRRIMEALKLCGK